MSEFAARVAHHDAATVIELAGDVAYETRDAVMDAVIDALSAPSSELVIDLREVTFIDSVGVEAAIVSPSRAATTIGMAFRVEPGDSVRFLIHQMGLDDLLERAQG